MRKINKNSIIPSICRLTSVLMCVLLITSCKDERAEPNYYSDNTDAVKVSVGATLGKTEDMGDAYIDGIIFIGESTTYHLKSRGVLRDGRDTKQVWAPSSGTMCLDSSIKSVRIVYPETNTEMTVGEAAKIKKPDIFMLTFGLNGAVSKVSRGEEYFKDCYVMLIDELRENSPKSKIILQSCPPITESMDTSAFSVSVEKLNEYIDKLNAWAEELCAERGTYYLESNEVLKNADGFLCTEYDAGDGYHLNTDAYKKMLEYIRTHGIKEREE